MVDFLDIREDDIFLTDIFEDVKTDDKDIYQEIENNYFDDFFLRFEEW